MLWTWLTQSRLWFCVCVCECVCVCSLLCMRVSIKQQQMHSISLLLQHSRRSSGSNTHTNQTQRCVGGHFEPTVSRAWAASEKMNRHYFRGGPRYTWGPHGWLSLPTSPLQELLYQKNSKSQQAASKTERFRRTMIYVGCSEPCKTDANISVTKLHVVDNLCLQVWKRKGRCVCVSNREMERDRGMFHHPLRVRLPGPTPPSH